MDIAGFPEMVHFSTHGITSQQSEIFRINSVTEWVGGGGINYFPTTNCCAHNTNTLMTVIADSYVPTSEKKISIKKDHSVNVLWEIINV
jgi:hypothetical protein